MTLNLHCFVQPKQENVSTDSPDDAGAMLCYLRRVDEDCHKSQRRAHLSWTNTDGRQRHTPSSLLSRPPVA